jgi:hypothetical protein
MDRATPENRVRNGRSVVVDHIRGTKTVRGLLHNDCNRAIGLLRDNPALLRAAAFHLENPVHLLSWQKAQADIKELDSE